MLIITKENNSIKVVGQNNPTYPYSGTLVYPLNSVTVVTDQSDMAVFRSALNNDVLFTGLIENITIAGSPVTKEDIGTKFGAIANSSSSGGGGTGGGAVDSVNGQTGAVVLTAADVNAYSKAETDEKLRDYTPLEAYATEIASIKKNMGNKADKSSLDNYLLKTEAASTYQPKGEYLTSIPEEYVTETELEGKGYALNTSLEAEVTERQKQDSALGGMIAGETQAREQAINNLTTTVQGKLDTSTYNADKATFALKTEIPSLEGYATEAWVTEQGYLTEHQDISGLATKEELNGKQNTLVSGTNIKTINSQSLLGEGNIEITVEGGGISDAPSDGKLYGRKNAQWTEVVIPDTSDLATKGELSAKLDTATYNEEKATFALKTEIPDTSTLATKSELSEGLAGKANTSDLSNYLTTANAQSTYATKSELGAKLDVETYNSDKATFALKSEVPKQYVQEIGFVAPSSINIFDQDGNYKMIGFSDGITLGENGENVKVKLDDSFVNKVNAKQDTLVSGTNIKTVNGNSLLGSGDITIEGGGSGIATWDYAQIQSDQEYRTNFLSNVKVSDDLTNLGGSDNPDHASILTIDGNVYTVMYNVGGNPKVASINIQDSVATITNIDAIPKNYATTEQLNGKQDTLVSGTNIKTVNGNSLLGSGNITIEGGGTSYTAGEGIDISEENVISVDKETLNIPTLQTNINGSTNNYVYSTGNTNSKKTNVIADIFFANDNTLDTLRCYVRYWGNDSTYDNFISIPKAERNRAGAMSSLDKAKLDTLKSEWFGTQSQFDGLDSKDENTLYFITEE